MHKKDFGKDFIWGVATSAFQTEGAFRADGKGPSIWDRFTFQKGKIIKNHHARIACDFYRRYREDVQLIKALNIPVFRFSIAWSRILPQGKGPVNKQGIDFYNSLIDYCLELGITPYVTLYHWDLPQELSKLGGWTNREIVHWFKDYTQLCVKSFGDRVKHWIVLNEPTVFTGAGYFLGVHAPGKRWLYNFLPAIHHAALCQAEGARVIRSLSPDALIGTSFSCAHIEPYQQTEKHMAAAKRVDALINRLFIEPSLGLNYPVRELKTLEKIEKYVKPGDEDLLPFDFDFIGIQNYTREVIKHSSLIPYINANLVKASARGVPTTIMGWEVYPEAIYKVLKHFHNAYGLKRILVTENGAAFPDEVKNGKINDWQRTRFLQDNLRNIMKARQEGIPVEGYFVWTLMDNFEWAEGYDPTFGLVHVNFNTQQRIIKSSGYWYQQFLSEPVNR